MLAVRMLLLLIALQTPSPAPSAAEPGSELRVTILTVGPGTLPWEKFGHNMLRIEDPTRDFDAAFNWGLFDFDQQNFIFNFIQGRLLYWMDAFDGQRTIDSYIQDGRTIWEQELNLSPAQRRALLEFCIRNTDERNKYYRYDYFKDNCSTRIRDALDRALNGELKRLAADIPSPHTYRSDSLRLMADQWLLYTGLDFVYGHPTDAKLSAWEEMFIPMRMRDRINEIQLADASGQLVPLVKSQRLLYQSRQISEREHAPNRIGWFTAIGVLIGGSMAGLVAAMHRSEQRRAAIRWAWATLAVIWSLVCGIAGVLLLYLWLLTDHAATRPNENLLQISPLLLPLIVLASLALRRRRLPMRIAMALAAVALALSVLGFVLQILPMMNQVNGNMIGLALPANAGLAWSIWQLSKKEAGHGIA